MNRIEKLESLCEEAEGVIVRLDYLCETAWCIIANVYGGNWELACKDWRNAAERWRDRWGETRPRVTSDNMEKGEDE